MLFRQFHLPPQFPGALFASHMPGSGEPFEEFELAVKGYDISRVICLAERDEIRNLSPGYSQALEQGHNPPVTEIPAPNYGLPYDRHAFFTAVQEVVELLRGGERVLIHCAAGIGRTGMFATCVLMALGIPLERAHKIVSEAGSGAQSEEQECFIEDFMFELLLP